MTRHDKHDNNSSSSSSSHGNNSNTNNNNTNMDKECGLLQESGPASRESPSWCMAGLLVFACIDQSFHHGSGQTVTNEGHDRGGILAGSWAGPRRARVGVVLGWRLVESTTVPAMYNRVTGTCHRYD